MPKKKKDFFLLTIKINCFEDTGRMKMKNKKLCVGNVCCIKMPIKV